MTILLLYIKRLSTSINVTFTNEVRDTRIMKITFILKKIGGIQMILKEFIYLANKEKRRKDKVKVVQYLAVGIGAVATAGLATGILLAPISGKETRENIKKKAVSTIGIIKDKVNKNVDKIKDNAENAEKEINDIISDIGEKKEDVKKDIKDGYNEITKDINKTAKNISSELEKSIN